VLRGLEIEARYKVFFWDALILQAAESAGATVLYSEDLAPGQSYGDVRVVNPFEVDDRAVGKPHLSDRHSALKARSGSIGSFCFFLVVFCLFHKFRYTMKLIAVLLQF
jgi:hypothetical protein